MARISSFTRFLAAAGAMALVLFAAAAPASAQQDGTQLNATPVSYAPNDIQDTYKLGTGDKLRVIVYGEDDLGGAFAVDSNGMVSLPLIGPVKVAGLSAREAERAITIQFADGYLKAPRVNVEVTEYRPFYVLGEVNRPGQYPYVNGMNVLNAVADAGGFTQKAIQGGFYLRRNGEPQETYVDADAGAKIYPGDVIRIDSSVFWDALSVLGPLAGFAAIGAAFHN